MRAFVVFGEFQTTTGTTSQKYPHPSQPDNAMLALVIVVTPSPRGGVPPVGVDRETGQEPDRFWLGFGWLSSAAGHSPNCRAISEASIPSRRRRRASKTI